MKKIMYILFFTFNVILINSNSQELPNGKIEFNYIFGPYWNNQYSYPSAILSKKNNQLYLEIIGPAGSGKCYRNLIPSLEFNIDSIILYFNAQLTGCEKVRIIFNKDGMRNEAQIFEADKWSSFARIKNIKIKEPNIISMFIKEASTKAFADQGKLGPVGTTNALLVESEKENSEPANQIQQQENILAERRHLENKSIGESKVKPPTVNTNSVKNTDRSDLELERQQLAEEKVKLNAEKIQREKERKSSRISITATATQPDVNGEFILSIQTSADTASLKIDGEEQGGTKEGKYTLRRIARIGEQNFYTISARDVYGNTDTKTISVARQIVDSKPVIAKLNPLNVKIQQPRDAVAIIIGIEKYKRVPKAEFANLDAKDFYNYAVRGLGIKPENIKLLLDEEADDIEIVKAFENWLPLQVNKDKTDVYVFYSGHGLPSTDGQSLYFLPYGVDKQYLARTAVGQREVVTALVASKPKSVTMFIDSCYSGQTRGGDVLLASVKPIALKAEISSFPSNFTVISASSNDQVSSSSPELNHGIFSFFLMKGMEGDADANKDGKITTGEMQEYLSDKVSRQALTMSRKQDIQLIGDSNRVLVGVGK